MDNKSLSHSRWKCQYHIVFIPKYRMKTLYGQVRNDVRGAVCIDHVHLSVAIPTKLGISSLWDA